MLNTKGSEWRKWDLHIHTPSTKKNNQFKGNWRDYFAKLVKSDIKAFGLTDYLLLDGYLDFFTELETIKDSHKRVYNELKNNRIYFPNIEFRLTEETSERKNINIHLLININSDRDVSKIISSLSNLHFTEDYKCTKDDLIELGENILSKDASESKKIDKGIDQFKISWTTFIKWYDSQKWLKENSFIAVANKQTDGVSGRRSNESDVDIFYTEKKAIYTRSNFIFSSRKKDSEYFLGKAITSQGKNITKKEIISLYSSLKPCIHGSDAHCIEKVGQPDENRFTWIKADLTWDGLKQVIYMPEERVYIGETPNVNAKSKKIEKITVNNEGTRGYWFENTNIPVNSNLVTIIGARGSGKSALAEVIAYANEALPIDNDDFFLQRAKNDIKRTLFNIDGGSIVLDKDELFNGYQQKNDAPVKYYSQKYVDLLCGQDESSRDALFTEIKRIVMQNYRQSNSVSVNTFDEYIKIRTQSIANDQATIVEKIKNISESISLNIKEEKEIEEIVVPSIKRLEGELKTLREEQQSISKTHKETDKENILKVKIKDLNTLKEKQEKTNNFILNSELLEQTIREKNEEIQLWNQNLKSYYSKLKDNNVVENSISENLYFGEFKTLSLPERFSSTKANYIRYNLELTESIKALNGEVLKETKDLGDTAQKLEKINSAITLKERELLKFQVRENVSRDTIKSAFNSTGLFNKLIQNYIENLNKITEIYKELTSSVNGINKFEVITNAYFDESSFWSAIEDDLINNRYLDRLRPELKSILTKIKNSIDKSDNIKLIESLDDFFKLFNKTENIHQVESKYFKGKNSISTFLNFVMYEFLDLFKIEYYITYEGVELDRLSAGKKGIALIILLLKLDIDSRPLIIDQPEDNLDSWSVHNDLVDIFREKKKERQIILITHNPNLVINTDSEQVIIAKNNPDKSRQKISYKSGSIESMKEHICNILEGGKDAFLKRESVYSISD